MNHRDNFVVKSDFNNRNRWPFILMKTKVSLKAAFSAISCCQALLLNI